MQRGRADATLDNWIAGNLSQWTPKASARDALAREGNGILLGPVADAEIRDKPGL
jgi:hypothetical protein